MVGQISGIIAAVPREAKTVSGGLTNWQVYQEQVKTSTFGAHHTMDELTDESWQKRAFANASITACTGVRGNGIY